MKFDNSYILYKFKSYLQPQMTKELKNMSLEELWNLFPIVLVPHSSFWKEWAEGA